MVKCSVCGTDVDEKKSTHKMEQKGKTHHFCGEGCQSKFKAEPQKPSKAGK